MHRIYFDTNDGNLEEGYSLNINGSKTDLARIGDELCDGLKVIIYMTNEIEMEAVLKFDNDHGYWKAMPIKGTIIDLSGS